MSTIRFERREGIGSVVLANPPFNRLDLRFSSALREAVHAASDKRFDLPRDRRYP